MTRFVLGVVATLLVLLGVALAVVLAGAYNVAATYPHTQGVRWALDTTMERSVRRRAEQVGPPPGFTDAQVRKGFEHYGHNCIWCHGAPGHDPAGWSRGMRPEPPFMPEAARRWSPAELFWIVKHGIRMTGMPAFGPHHPDEEIWEIVALLQRLPELSPEQYRRLGQEGDGDGESGSAGGGQGQPGQGR